MAWSPKYLLFDCEILHLTATIPLHNPLQVFNTTHALPPSPPGAGGSAGHTGSNLAGSNISPRHTIVWGATQECSESQEGGRTDREEKLLKEEDGSSENQLSPWSLLTPKGLGLSSGDNWLSGCCNHTVVFWMENSLFLLTFNCSLYSS